jgi:hypothetical protein
MTGIVFMLGWFCLHAMKVEDVENDVVGSISLARQILLANSWDAL